METLARYFNFSLYLIALTLPPAMLVITYAALTRLSFSNWIAIPAALIGAFEVYRMVFEKDDHVRGKRRVLYVEARDLARQQLAANEAGFDIGGITLPKSEKNTGILYYGQQGSGKTLSMSLLMYDNLRGIGKGSTTRAVIYDNKMNQLPFLYSVVGIPKDRIHILNPYDRRGSAWDIQKDVTDVDTALDIAKGFVPEKEGDNGHYFTNGARTIFHGVLKFYFYRARSIQKENEQRRAAGKPLVKSYRYTLRDVLLPLQKRYEPLLDWMFQQYSQTENARVYLNRKNDDILSTLENDLQYFRSIAAIWHNGKRPMISLEEWANKTEGEIILLGHDNKRAETINALNRVLFQQLKKALLGGKRWNREREMWFFLDEFPQLGRVPDFELFIPLVREYGGCVALGLQDVNLISAKDMYDEAGAAAIIGQCATKVYMKCSGKAAEYASQDIGTREAIRTGRSRHINSQGPSQGTDEREGEQRLITAGELSGLPKAGKENGLHAFYVPSSLPVVYKHILQFRDFSHVWSVRTEDEDYDRETNPDAFDLQEWAIDEMWNLGLPVELVRKLTERTYARPRQVADEEVEEIELGFEK